MQLRSAALHLLEAAPFDTLPRALALVRRADEATVRPVPAETLAMVTAVRRAVDDSDVPPSEDLAMVFVEGAIAEFMSGNRDAVAHYAQRAVDVAREAGADAAFASAVAVGGQATGFGLDLQFLPLIPEALSLVDADAPQRLALMAQAHLAACFFADGTDPVARTETLVTELEAAHAQGPVVGLSADIQAMAWWMAPWGYLAVADLDRQTELVARAVQSATELDHGGPEHLAGAYAAFRRGDRAGVADHIMGLAEGDQSRDIPLYLATGAQNEATLALFEGRLGDTPDLIDRVALAVPREPMFMAGVACQRAWLAYVGADSVTRWPPARRWRRSSRSPAWSRRREGCSPRRRATSPPGSSSTRPGSTASRRSVATGAGSARFTLSARWRWRSTIASGAPGWRRRCRRSVASSS